MSSVTDRRGVLSAQRRRDRLVRGRPRLLFLTPAVVLVGPLAPLPFALTVGRGFLDDAVVDPSFAGLSSYARLVTDPVIVRSSINTLFWLVGTVVIPVGLGLAIAALTNSVSWGKYARLAIVLPYALSGTAVAVVWNFVLQDTGALNSLFAWDRPRRPRPVLAAELAR
ncbi:hypothetical protein [Brachybacterium sp. GPGPB12]|uniref:carbohydrate ABC transporter permease n=1 Tax=Brachybacterium sp. GPGPB12 TaxID=3023517 RepID=UPI00313452F6